MVMLNGCKPFRWPVNRNDGSNDRRKSKVSMIQSLEYHLLHSLSHLRLGRAEFHQLHHQKPGRDYQFVLGRKVDEPERLGERGDHPSVELLIRRIDRQLQWDHAV